MKNQVLKRNTTQRTAIEQVFTQHERPLGVEELLAYGQKLVASLNKATIYRNLKILVDSGWLTPVAHPSLGTLYERTGKGHHHHFYCRVCNRTFDLLKKDDVAPEGFVVEDHEVFLFGICASCR